MYQDHDSDQVVEKAWREVTFTDEYRGTSMDKLIKIIDRSDVFNRNMKYHSLLGEDYSRYYDSVVFLNGAAKISRATTIAPHNCVIQIHNYSISHGKCYVEVSTLDTLMASFDLHYATIYPRLIKTNQGTIIVTFDCQKDASYKEHAFE